MSNKSYTPLRINTLKADISIPFSLFILFKDQYIEYTLADSVIEKSKFKKLRRQKIAKFFIQDSDEEKYQNFVDHLLNTILNKKDSLTEDKVNIIEGQAGNALSSMAIDVGNEKSYDATRKAAKNIQKLIIEDPKALQEMYSGNSSEEDPIIKHCLNVAALSIRLAKEMKLSELETDYLSTAALMHDVGLVQKSEQELFKRNKADLDKGQLKKYNLHCTDIIEILQDKSYINKDILELIYNHEENLTGTGPLRKTKLTLAQSILSLVNTYDKKISVDQQSPKEAIKTMMIDELGKYDLKHIQALQKVVKSQLNF